MNTRSLERLLKSLKGLPADALLRTLAQRSAAQPRCAVTRYLLGCHCFERGRAAVAVRHMMIAHHAEPKLESAALLVFAGLNWVSRRGMSLLPVLLDTWNEFRRPKFDRTRCERMLLDAFADGDAAPDSTSLLAARLWRLPIATLRRQIGAAVVEPGGGPYPLLLAQA